LDNFVKEVEGMEIKEIKAEELDPQKFIKEKVEEIKKIVGDGRAIVALSGGVDSSVTTILAHKALGDKLKVYFIDNGIMRENEPEMVASTFKKLGIDVEIVDAKKQFFEALKGITDPEEKREAITQTFYRKVLAHLVKKSGAKFLLHGTILTDIEETVAGIKRQHNILVQLGIDPEKEFGYQVIEPLKQIRKDGVRKVAKALGLPESIWNRMPFPGPALACRIIGEVTPEKVEIVRKATAIVEEELKNTNAFQYMAILHEDKVTGIREGKRKFGYQIEVRCWDSVDARMATPTKLPFEVLEKLAKRITTEIPSVVSVTYNITSKPPSTMEAV
jgi:GMP synthase (glutamine-hydrolysing)